MQKRVGRTGRPWRRLAAQVRAEESICWVCGHPIDKTLHRHHPLSFTVDHVIPVTVAPYLALVRSNLRAAHKRCNSRRGNRMQTQTLATSRAW